jgi:hypothetical protein
MISRIGYTLIEIKRTKRATPRSGVIFDALSARQRLSAVPLRADLRLRHNICRDGPRSGRLALLGAGPRQTD